MIVEIPMRADPIKHEAGGDSKILAVPIDKLCSLYRNAAPKPRF